MPVIQAPFCNCPAETELRENLMKVSQWRAASPDRQSIMEGSGSEFPSRLSFGTEKLYMNDHEIEEHKASDRRYFFRWDKNLKTVWWRHEDDQRSPWGPPGCSESKARWPEDRWPCPGSSNAAGTASCWWSSPSPAPRCSSPCSSLRRGKRGRSLRRRRGGWAGWGRPNFGWSSR